MNNVSMWLFSKSKSELSGVNENYASLVVNKVSWVGFVET